MEEITQILVDSPLNFFSCSEMKNKTISIKKKRAICNDCVISCNIITFSTTIKNGPEVQYFALFCFALLATTVSTLRWHACHHYYLREYRYRGTFWYSSCAFWVRRSKSFISGMVTIVSPTIRKQMNRICRQATFILLHGPMWWMHCRNYSRKLRSGALKTPNIWIKSNSTATWPSMRWNSFLG